MYSCVGSRPAPAWSYYMWLKGYAGTVNDVRYSVYGELDQRRGRIVKLEEYGNALLADREGEAKWRCISRSMPDSVLW